MRDINSVAVIGAGTMGGGIAMNFLNAGIPVKMLEMKQEALDRGVATIRKNYEAQVAKKSSSRTSTSSAWRCSHHAELRRPDRHRPRDRSRVRGHRRQEAVFKELDG